MKKSAYAVSALLSVVIACPAFAQAVPAPAPTVKTEKSAPAAKTGKQAIATPSTKAAAEYAGAGIVMQPVQYPVPYERFANVDCMHHTSGTLNIQFNYTKTDIPHLGKEIADKIAKIEEIARHAGATGIRLTSENYNVRTGGSFNGGYDEAQSGSGVYIISGNLSFDIKPAEKGTDIMSQLSEKSYRANFNYRMDSGYCPFAR